VVDRLDVVRVFVDVPEQDANYVQIGTKASVLARAFSEKSIQGTVTRTSWALNVKSRTLRAEIDLANPESRLLPGMYAYANVMIERPGVMAVPTAALVHTGDQTFYWSEKSGQAVRIEIQTGVSDGEWTEVTNRRAAPSSGTPAGDVAWVPIDGSEQVIDGDVSVLTEGAPIRVAPEQGGATVASAAS
jgi:hypothetical protein